MMMLEKNWRAYMYFIEAHYEDRGEPSTVYALEKFKEIALSPNPEQWKMSFDVRHQKRFINSRYAIGFFGGGEMEWELTRIAQEEALMDKIIQEIHDEAES